MITWLNENNGAVMAGLTFVYVIATILICVFNYKSAAAARKQTEESHAQFIESTRARVIPKFTVLEGQLYCLTFQNVGHAMAENLTITISDIWLEALGKTKYCSGTVAKLKKLGGGKFFLPEGEQYSYALCALADGTGDFQKLIENEFSVDITYTSNGIEYAESYTLPLAGIDCLINTSDYVRLEKKKVDALNDIASSLKAKSNS